MKATTTHLVYLAAAVLNFASGMSAISIKNTASICPLAESIDPCTCAIEEDGSSIFVECRGSEVTQTVLEKVMEELRIVNGVSGPNDWLEINRFSMSLTNIVQLNLTPFIRTRFFSWVSHTNRQMTSIIGPALTQEENVGLIEAQQVLAVVSPLVDEGVKDLLKYFSPQKLTYLDLQYDRLDGSGTNEIGDGSGDIEFMRGMGALSNLSVLYLYSNQIGSVEGGQFKRNTRLTQLDLSSNNLDAVGMDAFLFDEPPADIIQEPLSLDCSYNALHQDKIDPNSGVDHVQRPVRWRLSHNQLTSLPSDKFQPFLDAQSNNTVVLDGNPIQCDGQVKWLKDRREEYEPKVIDANCQNDPGQTVFTSSLVDGRTGYDAYVYELTNALLL